MARHWEKMWQFETANFRIEWDITSCDDTDVSWDESGETLANLQSGLWQAFDSRMQVVHKPTGAVLGEDYLGQSIYENPSDFRDHIGAQGKYGSYFRDMVHGACKEAREALRKLQATKVHQ